jgi:putative transposase
MEYVSQNHSKHLLLVHLIFVCKYRKQLLIKFGEQIKTIFMDIAKEHTINIVEMEVDKKIEKVQDNYRNNNSEKFNN